MSRHRRVDDLPPEEPGYQPGHEAGYEPGEWTDEEWVDEQPEAVDYGPGGFGREDFDDYRHAAQVVEPRTYRAEKKRRGRAALWVSLLVVVVLVGGVALGVVYAAHKLFAGDKDYSGAGTTAVTVQVKSGDTASAIADTLFGQGVVASSGAFRSAASDDPNSRNIQPGYYGLKLHMKASLALAALENPKSLLDSKVVIPEGFTTKQILARIAAHTKITQQALDLAVASPTTIGLPSYANGKVEGFLFPATYDIDPGKTAPTALAEFTAAFQRTAGEINLTQAAAQRSLTPLQVVTIASLLQAEVQPQDFAKVAEVIYNRLHDDHPLGLETAERYAVGIDGNTPLTQSLLAKAKQTGYDTYSRVGLPVGPIDNPGKAALQAALAPASGDLYFYVTSPTTGKTEFFARNDYAGFQAASNACLKAGGCR